MAENVNVDPVRAHAIYNAWGQIHDDASAKGPVGMVGSDLLDGASFALLKAEFLAAEAGVVPFVPLPGGGKGVMTVGGAISMPDNKWPQPELRTLYYLNHKASAAMHGSLVKRRIQTPMLNVPASSPSQFQDEAAFFESVGAGAAQMAALPAVAWLVISAVGILATMAASYYATRTKLEEIQVDAQLAKDQHAIGSLTELAQLQLAATGKIDPDLIGAIRNTGSQTSWGFWPYVVGGTGLVLAGGVGTYALMRRKGRR